MADRSASGGAGEGEVSGGQYGLGRSRTILLPGAKPMLDAILPGAGGAIRKSTQKRADA
jgi:hypothetical protein